MTEYNIQVRA